MEEEPEDSDFEEDDNDEDYKGKKAKYFSLLFFCNYSVIYVVCRGVKGKRGRPKSVKPIAITPPHKRGKTAKLTEKERDRERDKEKGLDREREREREKKSREREKEIEAKGVKRKLEDLEEGEIIEGDITEEDLYDKDLVDRVFLSLILFFFSYIIISAKNI